MRRIEIGHIVILCAVHMPPVNPKNKRDAFENKQLNKFMGKKYSIFGIISPLGHMELPGLEPYLRALCLYPLNK